MADLSKYALPSVFGETDCFNFANDMVTDITGQAWSFDRPAWLTDCANERDAAHTALHERGYATLAEGIAHVLGLSDGKRFMRVEACRTPRPGDIAIVRGCDGETILAVCDRDHVLKRRAPHGVADADGEVMHLYRIILKCRAIV